MRQMNLFSTPSPLSVSDLTRHIREMFEIDYRLQDVWVEGEVSGVTRSGQGHVYFTLKDAAAQISCVMWRTTAAAHGRSVVHGAQVVARGRVSVYEARGAYQLYVEHIQPVGRGDLHAQFEQLKARLAAEGLFAPERKRPLPAFPRCIGLVTSPTGAVIRDICTVLARRWPLVEVILSPSLVQGSEAPPRICAALDALYRCDGIDLVILARGGGSLEDLWCFNDERVARKVFESPLPVVSAVGHETDFTIADFVADVRAPTPSAAAELVTPDRDEIAAGLAALRERLESAASRLVGARRQAYQVQARALAHLSPQARVLNLRQRADDLATQAALAAGHVVQLKRARLEGLASRLEALNPLAVLRRGYAIVRRDGHVVTRAAQVQPGDALSIRVSDGEFPAVVRPNSPDPPDIAPP